MGQGMNGLVWWAVGARAATIVTAGTVGAAAVVLAPNVACAQPPSSEITRLQAQEDVAEHVRRLARRGDARSTGMLERLVERGLPPGVLASLLDTVRNAPRPEFAPMLWNLFDYRRVAVRARALHALVRLGDGHRQTALLLGMDDADAIVRKVAYLLAAEYSDPKVEEARMDLLARDRVLAAELLHISPPPP